MRVLLVPASLVLAAAVIAQPGPEEQGTRPDHVYAEIHAAYQEELGPALGDLDFASAGLKGTANPGGVAGTRALLRASQSLVSRALEASKQEKLGGDHRGVTGDPFAAVAPAKLEITGQIRCTYRLLRADAARCWEEGDRHGCAVRIAAIVRVSRQCAGESVLLSMTGSALLASVEDSIGVYTQGEAAWDAGDRGLVATELAKLSPADPCGAVRAWQDESRAVTRWLREELRRADAATWWTGVLEKEGVTEQDLKERDARMREFKVPPSGEWPWASLPRKLSGDVARGLTQEKLTSATESATQAADDLAGALASGDVEQKAHAVRVRMNADATQITRVVLGVGPTLVEQTRKQRELVEGAKRRLSPGS